MTTSNSVRDKISRLHAAVVIYRGWAEEPSIQMQRTRSRTKAAMGQFRFLDLPPELRNQIYRLVLLDKNVTKRVPNQDFLSSRHESRPLMRSYEETNDPTGTIRSQSVWIYTLEFQLQLLRVNRQIYEEASSIFGGENGWVNIVANKTGFGQDLEDHGYTTIYRKPLGRKVVKYPVLQISITFFGPHVKAGYDTFIIPTAGIAQFPRALWTLKNCEMMKIFYDTSPDYSNHPVAARKVVRGLSRLWSHSIFAREPPTEGRVRLPNYLPKAIPENDQEIPRELLYAYDVIQQHHRDGNIRAIVGLCEEALAFVADCYKIYNTRQINTSASVTHDIAAVIISIALSLAEAKMALRHFKFAAKYCSYALYMDQAHFGFPQAALTPSTQRWMFPQTTKAWVLLMRGQAYLALGMRRQAREDYEGVLQLIPAGKNELVDRLTELMFRPFTDQSRNVEAMQELRISETTVGKERERAGNK